MKFITVTFFMFFLTTACNAEEKLELNFFGEMDRKLRVMLVGAPDGYEKAFIAADNQEIVDHQQYVSSINEADLLIIFIHEWSSAQYLDESWDPNLKNALLNLPADQVFNFFGSTNEQNEPLFGLLFYNRTHTDNMEISCVAQDVFNIFMLTTSEYEKVHIANC